MLINVELHNYKSYRDVAFNFSDSNVINVSGDIGAGKSAILSSVAYLLYGISDVSVDKLVKCGTDEMFCKGTLSFEGNKTIKIFRGVKSNGKGFLNLLDSEGNILSTGNQAQAEIIELIGMSADNFYLVSFFGSGVSDTLIDVLPSVRLETLQTISKVDVFNTLLEKANQKKVEIQNEITESNSRLDEITKRLSDTLGTDKEIKSKKEKLESLESGTVKLNTKRNVLMEEFKSVTTMLNELINYNKKVIEVSNKIKTYSDNKDSFVRRLKTINEKVIEYKKQKKQLTVELDEVLELIKDEDIIRQEQTELTQEQGKVVGDRDLRQSSLLISEKALSGKGNLIPECPLCGNEVDKEKLVVWGNEVKNCGVKLSRIKTRLNEISDLLSNKQKLVSQLGSVDNSLITCTNDVVKINQDLKEIEKNLNILNPELITLKEKVKVLNTSIGKSKDIEERIEKVNTEISEGKKLYGVLSVEIKDLQTISKERKSLTKELGGVKERITELKDDLAGCLLLCKAYSRYGIPFDLLKGLKNKISKEASRLYKYFNDGDIEVKDIEYRGKPGISYQLTDVMGSREYEQLSTGQKVLLPLCVRLAVSFILRSQLKINTDVLMLDEVAANLSELKRDRLVVFIVEVLKKYFKQIFVISHSPLRDVFDTSYSVSLVNGESTIKK
jgi:DNA repair exonuclease SbcCD ATPase subunit